MTFGSLFSGIGGMDLGLERAGMTVRWQVEIDPFCNRVLERHWPSVRRHGDVRLCGVSELEAVGLIAGGFPCQDISAAGKGAGLSGERSGLWFEFLRIVRELRPGWVLVENVPTLRTRGADVVLDGLEAEGYATTAVVVGACSAGAPHHRHRAFVVAHALERSDPPCRRLASEEQGRIHDWPGRPADEPPDGVPRRLAGRRDALRALGNAVVPQVAEVIGRAILRTASREGSAIEPTS